MPTAKLTQKTKLPQLKKALEELGRKEVAVGWVGAKNSRRGDKLQNSEVAFLLEHGSPLHGTPARPVLRPAIERDKKMLVESVAKASKMAMDGEPEAAMRQLQRTGIMAENSVKRFMADPANGLAPNKPSTIRRKGSSQPSIDTGQLRQAVTSVIRDKNDK